MKQAQLSFESERAIRLFYKSVPIEGKLAIDLLVEGLIVVELKAVESMHPVYQSQVITYLILTGSPSGLLLNFNVTAMRLGIKRLHHPDLYKEHKSSFPS